MKSQRVVIATIVWFVAGAYVLLLTYFTLAPDPWWFMGSLGRETEESLDTMLVGYVQHAGTYGVMAALLVTASLTTHYPAVSTCAIATILHGGMTEGLQHFIPLRTCDWTDGLANVVGAVLGWIIAVIIAGAFRRSTSNEDSGSRTKIVDIQPES